MHFTFYIMSLRDGALPAKQSPDTGRLLASGTLRSRSLRNGRYSLAMT